MEPKYIDSNTPRLVLRMAGPAAETFRLFALFCEKHGNVSIAEVRQ